MIDFKPSSHKALLYSLVAGIFAALLAHLIKDSFELDLNNIARAGIVLLSAFLVGTFGKKIYDNYEKIVNYDFPESAPLKIKENIRDQISSFKENIFFNYQTKSYLLIYGFLFIIAVCFKPKTQDIVTVGLAQVSVVSFIVFSGFLSAFLFKINAHMNEKINELDRKKDVEQARQDLISSIQKTKKEFQKNNNMQRKYKDVDVQNLIEKLRSDDKDE